MKKEKPSREELLSRAIENFKIGDHNTTNLINAFAGMRGVAGDLANAAKVYEKMLEDRECVIFLTIAGSSSAQGLMDVWPDIVRNRMADALFVTGATIIDMDLYDALGFKHYHGDPNADNEHLGNLQIDRIYDTYIDEERLLKVDRFCEVVFDNLGPGKHAPWKILREMGRALHRSAPKKGSLLETCFLEGVPIFSPSFTDSAFGMGSSYHQIRKDLNGEEFSTVDTTREYLDPAKIKLASQNTGLFMIGGGIPKNAAQDEVIVAQGLLETLRQEGQYNLLEIMGYNRVEKEDEVPLHKYAVQITVADPRDGACSSSTLQEARSWGKVDLKYQQMVFAEATLAIPIVASAVIHAKNWREYRSNRRLADKLDELRARDFLSKGDYCILGGT